MSTPENPNIVVRLAATDDEWMGSPAGADATELTPTPQAARTAFQLVADANRHQQLGDTDLAIQRFEAALSLDRQCAAAYAGLGELLMSAGRLTDAAQVYQSWFRVDPRHPAAANGLGVVLQALGRLDEAAAAFRRSLEIQPENAAALNNLGTLLRIQNKPHEGLPYLRRALQLDPDNATTLTNLSFALLNLGHISEANDISRRAIARDPNSGNGQLMLGFGLVHQAKIAEALACFEEAWRCDPSSPVPVANYLFTTLYSDDLSAEEIAARHREWAGRIPLAAARRTDWSNTRDPRRRLNVGYLSHDLRSHPVAFFLEPILQNHSPDAVETFCYSTNPSADDVTERMRQSADHWCDAAAMDDGRLEARIVQDRIDILVDLSGHTSCNRAGLLRRKPAPIQVLYIGYPSTSGMAEMDYLISDHAVSPEESEFLYSEQVLRLPGSFWCYRPHKFAPSPGPLPSSTRGHITFGSFNNSAKLSASTIRLWSDVLRSVPKSQLVLKALGFADEATRELFREQFTAHGLAADRVLIEPPTMQIEHFLRSYGEIDIALDATPYNGGTTTCEALWMGVPVVTLSGKSFASRMSRSLLSNVGLADLVADSPADFVRLAGELASDLPRLAALRRTLRETMRHSPICDATRAARELESAYRRIWQDWIADDDRLAGSD